MRFLLLTVAFLAFGKLTHSAEPFRLQGKYSWGMSVDDVAKLDPAAKKEEISKDESLTELTTQTTVSGREWKMVFQFHRGSLYTIYLSRSEDNGFSSDERLLSQRMSNALKEKYGPGVEKSYSDNGYSFFWDAETTDTKLSHSFIDTRSAPIFAGSNVMSQAMKSHLISYTSKTLGVAAEAAEKRASEKRRSAASSSLSEEL